MKKFSEKGRRVLRTIFRGLGVTAVSFIFQACYGPPMEDVTVYGSVKSKTTNDPIEGIRVSVEEPNFQYLTRSDGNFSVLLPRQDTYTFTFEDPDGPENGGDFKQRSITVGTHDGESHVNIQVELEEVEEETDD